MIVSFFRRLEEHETDKLTPALTDGLAITRSSDASCWLSCARRVLPISAGGKICRIRRWHVSHGQARRLGV